MSVILRPANESDIPSINAIHKYYIENTVITFTVIPKTDEEALKGYHAVTTNGLPYIVAVDEHDKVLGYCYASPFRGVKGGYLHSAELTLFVALEEQGKRIGSMLLAKLIEIMKEPEKNSSKPYFQDNPKNVRALLACMALDVTGKGGGEKLKEFYERFGFQKVGQLKNVGYKFDKWYVSILAQLNRQT